MDKISCLLLIVVERVLPVCTNVQRYPFFVPKGDKNKKNGLWMKKMLQKFGGFKESRYLCTRNSEMNYYLLLQ